MYLDSTPAVNSQGHTFESWYALADEACVAICGLGIDDLPDGNSYDAWADGCPPAEYAREQVTAEADDMGFFGLFD